MPARPCNVAMASSRRKVILAWGTRGGDNAVTLRLFGPSIPLDRYDKDEVADRVHQLRRRVIASAVVGTLDDALLRPVGATDEQLARIHKLVEQLDEQKDADGVGVDFFNATMAAANQEHFVMFVFVGQIPPSVHVSHTPEEAWYLTPVPPGTPVQALALVNWGEVGSIPEVRIVDPPFAGDTALDNARYQAMRGIALGVSTHGMVDMDFVVTDSVARIANGFAGNPMTDARYRSKMAGTSLYVTYARMQEHSGLT